MNSVPLLLEKKVICVNQNLIDSFCEYLISLREIIDSLQR